MGKKDKFTPGPWESGKSKRLSDGWDIYAPDPSKHADEGDLMIVAEDLTEANAHLIAAAPAMFAALDKAERTFRHGEDPEGEVESLAEIRDALAAARGAV